MDVAGAAQTHGAVGNAQYKSLLWNEEENGNENIKGIKSRRYHPGRETPR